MSGSEAIQVAPAEEKATIASRPQDEDASDHSGNDVEKLGITQFPELKRKLKARHLQMIAIGRIVDYDMNLQADMYRRYNWNWFVHWIRGSNC